MINERDWQNTFDGTDAFSHKCYGIISVHLAYIIRKDSTPKEKEDTDMDDPLEQMIERVPHTLTEVNDTIIKHRICDRYIERFFNKLAELTRDHSAGPTSSLMQEPEMAEQPTWPSRTIILGPTTLAIWQQQQSTS